MPISSPPNSQNRNFILNNNGNNLQLRKKKQQQLQLNPLYLILILQVIILGTYLHMLLVSPSSSSVEAATKLRREQLITQARNNNEQEQQIMVALKDTEIPKVHPFVLAKKRTYDPNSQFIFDKSTTLPEWMKEYFHWHYETKSKLTPSNINDTNFLVLQCLANQRKCGGVSDRLKPIPAYIKIAAQHKRLFLIQWTKPFELEEFLIPPQRQQQTSEKDNDNDGGSIGIDWTVPEWMKPILLNDNLNGPTSVHPDKIEASCVNSANHIVRTRMMTNAGGSDIYNNNPIEINEKKFEEIYHDVWFTLFRPSNPVNDLLQKVMIRANLQQGQYVAAHFRAFYGMNDRNPKEIKDLSINAIHCATELKHGGPVYFASDSKLAVDHVMSYGKEKSLPVKSYVHEKEALHLDMYMSQIDKYAPNNPDYKFQPSDFYSIFVDLYLLGYANCVSYGQGGYGKYGLLISSNSSCYNEHYLKANKRKFCKEWIQ